MRIDPGQAITVVVSTNLFRDTIDVRHSMVCEISEKKIIIAQTDPPIPEGQANKLITLSYLTREKGAPIRYGFSARILDFIKDYRLASSQSFPAIRVVQHSRPEQHNLRICYRVEPPSNSGLKMFIDGKPVNLINISINGAAFSHNDNNPLKTGVPLGFTLGIDDQSYQVKSTITRISSSEEQRKKQGLEFVSLEFMSVDMELKKALGKKIIDLQRELSSRKLNP